MTIISARKRKDAEQEERRLVGRAHLAQSTYVLDLAAANAHYRHLRNDQLPELIDVGRKNKEWGSGANKKMKTTAKKEKRQGEKSDNIF